MIDGFKCVLDNVENVVNIVVFKVSDDFLGFSV